MAEMPLSISHDWHVWGLGTSLASPSHGLDETPTTTQTAPRLGDEATGVARQKGHGLLVVGSYRCMTRQSLLVHKPTQM
ncbi:hypothetical protein DCS_04119 [Drechmeria coniospora]|uniref:Uncharacterized protein n=1 Tax=Drechmeria coniospora TaxID=98403 RepID=A0A151GJC0_DRECN|nr:hypothetical protein DCS_04119 [Drechmeria coniospora]KYK57112.1 hypothetical protein DCS_04119 [Drechmeria coniospora]